MGEELYPYYYPHSARKIEMRTMKQIKADFNKNLQRHSMSKTKMR